VDAVLELIVLICNLIDRLPLGIFLSIAQTTDLL